mmetsp:Transcript_34626/g.55121  ORF Transcript_34626/g.55121 Transcript_34626/m.55121 type:complete len:244 (-) Transcript_34626:262-993(-)
MRLCKLAASGCENSRNITTICSIEGRNARRSIRSKRQVRSISACSNGAMMGKFSLMAALAPKHLHASKLNAIACKSLEYTASTNSSAATKPTSATRAFRSDSSVLALSTMSPLTESAHAKPICISSISTASAVNGFVLRAVSIACFNLIAGVCQLCFVMATFLLERNPDLMDLGITTTLEPASIFATNPVNFSRIQNAKRHATRLQYDFRTNTNIHVPSSAMTPSDNVCMRCNKRATEGLPLP